MIEENIVYGKGGCPYTRGAREDLAARGVPYTYKDVLQDGKALQEMLRLSKGRREVPVILEDGKVRIGFHGS